MKPAMTGPPIVWRAPTTPPAHITNASSLASSSGGFATETKDGEATSTNVNGAAQPDGSVTPPQQNSLPHVVHQVPEVVSAAKATAPLTNPGYDATLTDLAGEMIRVRSSRDRAPVRDERAPSSAQRIGPRKCGLLHPRSARRP